MLLLQPTDGIGATKGCLTIFTDPTNRTTLLDISANGITRLGEKAALEALLREVQERQW